MKNKDIRILFWGGTIGNNGPENINKGIVAHLSERFVYVTARNRYIRTLKLFSALLWVDVLVVSGVGRMNSILVRAAKLLGKPSVYLMHGCADFEYRINGREPNPKALKWEACLLEHATLLLPVSRRFMCWVHGYYPQYKNKTAFLYNGVDKKIFTNGAHNVPKTRDIAVAGGLQPQKMNAVVAEAVESMDGAYNLDIYGGTPDETVNKIGYYGNLEHELFLRRLRETRLFVLNSVLESFSIVTLEALACGCSLLVSEAAGVADLLAMEESDIIHNPENIEEIRRKMEYLLQNPNNDRLRNQFDPEQWSFEKMVAGLESCCRELLEP